MWKRHSGIAASGVAVLRVAAACTTPVSDGDALQPTGGWPVEAATATAGQMLHAGTDDVIDIELSEFAITAVDLEFTPGESVAFRVIPTGIVAHEFRLSNQPRVDEHVGAGHDAADMEDMEEMDSSAEESADHDEAPGASDEEHEETPEAEDIILFLEPGDSGTVVVHLPENLDDYTAMVCLVPGHYEAGMATDLSYSA